ncbi:hypothetical protein GPK34_02285 [Secundilactobacillus kimchicus]|uniref:hypothetical protein n=1 Tax=Secundilactobacillus kimchicus TaxID=528209 RepID=UPI0007054B0E|nr:hypothetical protein [Secundilactobacillus kimchicus]MBT9670867.1 hypothetical protein [Secundilactobacillus kimchicus]
MTRRNYCNSMYRTYSGYNSVTDLKIERDLEQWFKEKRCAEKHAAFKFGEVVKVRKQDEQRQ